MICFQGHGVSKGLAKGPVCFYRRAEAPAIPTEANDPAGEKRRLADAAAESVRQLRALAETAREKAGDEAALLFEAHALLLEDEDFTGCMNAAIEAERCTAGRAVALARDQFAAMLAATGDATMQARADDVRDVARRILNNLTGAAERAITLNEPAILAAAELSPSETLLLDKSKLLGLLTQGGSGNSHTAILARTLGIPAVCAGRPHSGDGRRSRNGDDRPGRGGAGSVCGGARTAADIACADGDGARAAGCHA